MFPRWTPSFRSPWAQNAHAAEMVSPAATPMNLKFRSLALPPVSGSLSADVKNGATVR